MQNNKYRPMVYILPKAKVKLDTYVMLAKGEISGMGIVRNIRRGVLLIEDLYIFEQECTMADTILNRRKIGEFVTDMIIAGKDPSVLRLWWHSHANMDVFWSVTDDGTISGFNNEWMLSLVTNFAGDVLCRIDAFAPVQTTALETRFQVLLEAPELLLASLRREVAAKVVFIEPKPVKVNGKAVYVPES